MRALIIDDDESSSLILVSILHKIGVTVQTANTISVSKNILQSWKPRVIFLDIFLNSEPDGLDGLDFLGYLKNNHDFSTIPVIMVSGSCRYEAISSCLKAGASSYLIKPVQMKLLTNILKNIGFPIP